jgi:hypothetical protein
MFAAVFAGVQMKMRPENQLIISRIKFYCTLNLSTELPITAIPRFFICLNNTILIGSSIVCYMTKV